MIRKKNEMKKRVGKGDKKNKDKTMGTFPLSEILSGQRTKMRPKKKKKEQNRGNFPTQQNFEWEKGQKFWGNI